MLSDSHIFMRITSSGFWGRFEELPQLLFF
jgi:hypothetical protein